MGFLAHSVEEQNMLSLVSRVIMLVLANALLASPVLAAEAPDWAYPGCPKPIGPEQKDCAYCHLSTGAGRPENAKISGLSAAYIVGQARAFRTGERQAAKSDWFPTHAMVEAVADLDDEQLTGAATQMARQPARSFVKVVEATQVPNHEVWCYFILPKAGPSMELGQRIVEIVDDVERFKAIDPEVTYTAYVPQGSIARGRLLAAARSDPQGKSCEECHGPNLKGGEAFPGPPLAGRFPGYVFRQLYAFQSGARRGGAAEAMLPFVKTLTQADMIDLAAFAASLQP
jgi:cytochrome c553